MYRSCIKTIILFLYDMINLIYKQVMGFGRSDDKNKFLF